VLESISLVRDARWAGHCSGLVTLMSHHGSWVCRAHDTWSGMAVSGDGHFVICVDVSQQLVQKASMGAG
jgi:hypothetical protein